MNQDYDAIVIEKRSTPRTFEEAVEMVRLSAVKHENKPAIINSINNKPCIYI